MSRTTKVLLVGGGALGCALVLLLALPFLFVDRIEARVRSEIERAARLQVSWTDVGLSVFSDFPNPTFTLRGLTVLGTGRFEGDTLAAMEDFGLSLNGASLLRSLRGSGPLVIRSVRLAEPRIRLRVDGEGVSSWDVTSSSEGAPTGGAASGPGISVSLRDLEISGGDLVYDDASSGMFLSIAGLRHTLAGDFSREVLGARTSTHADEVTLRVAGAPYLTGVTLDFDGEFEVESAARRARFTDNELRLNELALRLDGTVARGEEGVAMDLSFGAPSTEFAQLLSLASVIYERDFASLQTSGTFALDGSVRGVYGPAAFPSFSLGVEVADGTFRYPDLPLPARDIAASLAIANPGGDVDSTVVELSAFHIAIGEETLDAALTVRTPRSDPDIDLMLRGTLDLADVARTIKLADAEGLGGVIVADARLRARRSDVDSARYDRIAADGSITARDVTLRSEGLRQPVDIEEARLRLTPQTAELQAFRARLGSSDLEATGSLDDLLGFALGYQPLRGTGRFTSRRFLLDEWRSDDELAVIPVPAMLDLTLDGAIDELELDGLTMTDARGRAIVREQRLTFEGFRLRTLGGRVALDGYYETVDPARPTFSLDLGLDSLDMAGASAAFLTVRTLAPVAQYARGTFSSSLNVSGALGEDMTPVLDVLDGDGSLATSRMTIEGFPMLDRLGETLQLQRLSNPAVDAVRSSIRIQGGRLIVDPFDVAVGGMGMTVAGSNGIDQSIAYDLTLQVPRAGFADATLSSLASRAGPLGSRLAAVDPVPVTARVTGTVRQPSLDVRLDETARSARDAATQAASDEVQQRVDDARQQLDASEEEARRRAQARADSIVATAERQAEAIRAEAARAAAEVRAEGNRAADELLARATNPLARAAAQPAADRLRREAEERATGIEREADERATALVTEARERAAALVGSGGEP